MEGTRGLFYRGSLGMLFIWKPKDHRTLLCRIQTQDFSSLLIVARLLSDPELQGIVLVLRTKKGTEPPAIKTIVEGYYILSNTATGNAEARCACKPRRQSRDLMC